MSGNLPSTSQAPETAPGTGMRFKNGLVGPKATQGPAQVQWVQGVAPDHVAQSTLQATGQRHTTHTRSPAAPPCAHRRVSATGRKHNACSDRNWQPSREAAC